LIRFGARLTAIALGTSRRHNPVHHKAAAPHPYFIVLLSRFGTDRWLDKPTVFFFKYRSMGFTMIYLGILAIQSIRVNTPFKLVCVDSLMLFRFFNPFLIHFSVVILLKCLIVFFP